MNLNAEQLTSLLLRHITQQATPEERAQLEAFLSEDPSRHSRIAEILSREGFEAEKKLWEEAAGREERSLYAILSALPVETPGAAGAIETPPSGTVPLRRWLFAAASVAAITVATLILTHTGNRPSQPLRATAADLAPGGQHAVLTLSTGRQLQLDSLPNGSIAQDAGATVAKSAAGQLNYTASAHTGDLATFNILNTPKGGTYRIVLPDRTVVYLNAASSLTYPTSFSPRAPRTVVLTGEAYFEVAHDPARPFAVQVDGKTITALGTRFNVNAYADEDQVTATLLDGSIRVRNGADSVLLEPGQQAAIYAAQVRVTPHADTDAVIGWTTGDFVFNKAPLREVMKQLGRWYNVDVRYDSTAGAPGFTAEISRNRPASEVLKALELSGYKFTIVGPDRIEATPK